MIALAAASGAQAAWNQPIGGPSPINETSSTDAQPPSLANIGNVPYVAWSEQNPGNYQVRVARLSSDGTRWDKVGDSTPINYNTAADATSVVVTGFNGVPYVAWEEADPNYGGNNEIHVARLTSTGWQRVPDGEAPLNVDPTRFALPGLALKQVGGSLYLAWSEQLSCSGAGCTPPIEVQVRRLNSSGGWDPVGGSPAATAGDWTALPDIADVGGTPWLAFVETPNPMTSPLQVHVAKLSPSGSSWDQVGSGASPINQSPTGTASDPPSLANVAGEPYLAWDEKAGGSGQSQIYVKRLNSAGNGWDPAPTNSSLNHDSSQSASGPMLVGIGSTPYLAWAEGESNGSNQVRVQRLKADGSGWEELVGGAAPIDQSPSGQLNTPIGFDQLGGVPWVAWSENDGGPRQVRVSRLEPEFSNVAAEPLVNGATLLSSVNTYGLGFPLGFQYGAGNSFDSVSPLQPAAADTSAFFQSIGGLSPSVLYRARPVATAGVPLPLVQGPPVPFIPYAPSVPATTPFRLLLAVLSYPQSPKRGNQVHVRYLVTDPANVTMTINYLGRQPTRPVTLTAAVGLGSHLIAWSGRWHGGRARLGAYRITLSAVSPDGQRASDSVIIHLVKAKHARGKP